MQHAGLSQEIFDSHLDSGYHLLFYDDSGLLILFDDVIMIMPEIFDGDYNLINENDRPGPSSSASAAFSFSRIRWEFNFKLEKFGWEFNFELEKVRWEFNFKLEKHRWEFNFIN